MKGLASKGKLEGPSFSFYVPRFSLYLSLHSSSITQVNAWAIRNQTRLIRDDDAAIGVSFGDYFPWQIFYLADGKRIIEINPKRSPFARGFRFANCSGTRLKVMD
jgi:hypothetical protein